AANPALSLHDALPIYLSGQDPLHAWGLARARQLEVDGQRLVVAPPEYVILRKLEYYREGGSEKHLRDIRSMLSTSPQAIEITERSEEHTSELQSPCNL